MLLALTIFYRGNSTSAVRNESNASIPSPDSCFDEIDAFYMELSRLSRLSEAERKRGDKLEFKLKQKEVIINELMTPVKDATDIEMLKQLELERIITRDLTQRIEEITAERDQVEQQFKLLKHGMMNSMTLFRTLLNEFVAVCLQLPCAAKGSQLYRGFEEFQTKTDELITEMKVAVQSALYVARNDETTKDLVSEDEEDFDIENINEKTAKEILVRYKRKKGNAAKATNKKIIDNLRRVREMSLKVKSTEEKLAHVLAEKQMEKDDRLQEIARLRRALKERDSLWEDSHTKVAESMRIFVEQLQTTIEELYNEKEQMERQIAELTEKHTELQQGNQSLTAEVSRLESEASNEARRAVKEQLEELTNRNEELKTLNSKLTRAAKAGREGESEENATLRKKLEALQKDWEAKTIENSKLRQENATMKAAQRKSPQEFRPSQHLTQRSGNSSLHELMAQSLPYGIGSGSLLNDGATGTSLPGLGREFPQGGGPRSVASTRQSQGQLMQCLKCSERFPVAEVEDYERHVRKCYNIQSK
ncbi:putative leucine-rich repeat-containing protein DDB_G0290503 [Oscarella lobularis]|uniref:putative leucine-rich repeat-containing protein DDB_G0290503 n=1 Tax=Oscarella lobularis TaxID=121494 RepID=UPI003314055B